MAKKKTAIKKSNTPKKKVAVKALAAKGKKKAPAKVASAAKKAPAKVASAAKKAVKSATSAPGPASKTGANPRAAKTGEVTEGSSAPAFRLRDQDGNELSSGDLAGQAYVLYFYPRDDTPGCTVEACAFRDGHPDFSAASVRVIGVSPDTEKSHAKFREKYGLPFTLLSDPDRTLAKQYGVWVKKKLYGRESMGILRSTFLVDAAGKVRKAWRGVRVDGHAAAVLEAARAL